MKLSYLLVNLLVVGAGLFAYDALRSEPTPATHTAVVAPGHAQEPAPPTNGQRDIVLSGTGMEALQSRLDQLTKRIAALEATGSRRDGATASTSSGDPDTDPANSGSTGYQVPDVGDTDSPRLRPEEVSHFRALLDAVEKQRRDERQVQMVNAQVDRLNLSLTPDQKDAVVRETIQYREAMRVAIQEAAKSGNQESRTQAVQPVREHYEQRLRELVPSQDAETLVKSLAPWPGITPFMRAGGPPDRPNQDR